MKTVRRDTKKWAHEHERARHRLEAFILAHRGQPSGGYWYDFQLPTLAGPLWIQMADSWETIFTRFDFPERARALGIDCNPFTGKWNFNYDDHDAAFERFTASVGPYLIPPDEPLTDSYTRLRARAPFPAGDLTPTP